MPEGQHNRNKDAAEKKQRKKKNGKSAKTFVKRHYRYFLEFESQGKANRHMQLRRRNHAQSPALA